ncbi:MAG: hypothetical protein M1817_006582 [Caeruleum heppii]|nr:MAG: hypothetical protein M1817_006582 [Caeruleum heppii]
MSNNGAVPSNAHLVQIPSIIFAIVAPLFVAVRFWTRLSMAKGLGADDWTILTSMILSFSVSVLMLVACLFGFGRHARDIAPPDMVMTLRLFWFAQIFYKLNINLTKISILLLYLRIFIQKNYRRACWVLIVIIGLFGLSSAVASVFQCTPIRRAYMRSVQGKCINLTASWYANAAFSITMDLTLLILPMPVVWALRMPKRNKQGLMLVFALGGFVLVTSVLRMTTLDTSSKSPDPTWAITSSLWTVIEANVGIICACLPVLSRPLARVFPKVFSASTSNTHSSSLSGTGKSHPSSVPSDSRAHSTWYPLGIGKEGADHPVPLSSVHVSKGERGRGESESEEYMFAGDGAGIHKTTDFTVKWDGETSVATSKETH